MSVFFSIAYLWISFPFVLSVGKKIPNQQKGEKEKRNKKEH